MLQTVKQYEALVELPELKGVELRKWVAREYKRFGLDIESDKVVEATLELSNDSLDKAAAIVEHVSLFCDSQIVTTGTLSALFKGRFTGNEYALFHSAIKKDRPQTLGNLKDIQRGGMNAFPLLGLIFRNLSTTSSIAELKRKNFPDSQIQKILNLPPWLFTKHKESSLIYPLSNLTSHFRAVLRADSKLKNYSLGDESVIAEVLECFMAK